MSETQSRIESVSVKNHFLVNVFADGKAIQPVELVEALKNIAK